MKQKFRDHSEREKIWAMNKQECKEKPTARKGDSKKRCRVQTLCSGRKKEGKRSDRKGRAYEKVAM